MSDEKIELEVEIVTRKSPNFKNIEHKATAGLSEAEAIERNTIGSIGDYGEEREEEADV